MRTFIAGTFLLLVASFATGQKLEIPNTSLHFKLPNKAWSFHSDQKANGMLLNTYKRDPIKNADGRLIIPNIAFITQKVNDSMDVMYFSMLKRMNMHFDVNKIFIHSDKESPLKLKNAIGYEGTYVDEQDIEHTVFIMHIIDKGTGIQVIMDITSDLFPEYEGEFVKTTKSIR